MQIKKEYQLLLVEDDRPLGEATKAILTQYGFHVLWATDGEIALNHIESKPIDMIILDLGIPRIKGLDLFKPALTILQIMQTTSFPTMNKTLKWLVTLIRNFKYGTTTN